MKKINGQGATNRFEKKFLKGANHWLIPGDVSHKLSRRSKKYFAYKTSVIRGKSFAIFIPSGCAKNSKGEIVIPAPEFKYVDHNG